MPKRLSVEEKIKLIKLVRAGESVTDVCKKAGISRKTFYQWKKKYQQAPNRIKKQALELDYTSGKNHPKNKRNQFKNQIISIAVRHPSWRK